MDNKINDNFRKDDLYENVLSIGIHSYIYKNIRVFYLLLLFCVLGYRDENS